MGNRWGDEDLDLDVVEESEFAHETARVSPGKVSLTSSIATAETHDALQALGGRIDSGPAGGDPHEIAARGVSGGGERLPFLHEIQPLFGRHDVTNVRAHTGGAAREASDQLWARAFAFGDDVAFGGPPDLHTAAHEAAHVVQQRAGVQLDGGIGSSGDEYEQHADAVADAVVAGRSAEALLDQRAPGGADGGSGATQRKQIQRDIDPELLRERITQMRVENVMVLYVDALGNSTHDLYEPQSGIGQRRAWDQRFLRQPRNRTLLLSEFRSAVDRLVAQQRWETLYWLHTEFPERHMPDAAAGPLERMRSYIQTSAQAVTVGSGTGWDEMQNTRSNRQERQQAEAAQTRQSQSDVRDATRAIGAALYAAAGQRLHRIVFSTSAARTLGGHAHTLPHNWAAALERFMITLNQLRTGRTTAGGGIEGAPTTAISFMVDRATAAWNNLTQSQRSTLSDGDRWAVLARSVWGGVLQERLRWGIEEAGDYEDVNPETMDGGRWRNPGQAVMN